MDIQLYKHHLKETVKLAFPVAVGQLGHVMFGVVDSIMIGKVGADSLAAASLVNGIFFLILVLGIGMSLAITPLIAIEKGRGREDKIGIILRQGLLVNILFSLIIIAILFIISENIDLLNQPPEVAGKAGSYLKIITVSVIPFMLFQTYRQFIEGLSYTKPPMYIVLAANLVNVFGNYLLIYGHWGLPALGLDGAGWSSLITRIFMAAGLIIYVYRSKHFTSFDISMKFRNINTVVIKKLASIGLPSGFQYFFEIGAFTISAVMIGWIGSSSLAAHQIALNLASITYMIILGVSTAGTIRVGNAYGRENKEEIKTAGNSAIIVAVALMAVFGIIFILFRNLLPYIYVSEAEVIETASKLLIIAALFQVFDGMQATGLGVLRGLTDAKIPMILSIFVYWIVGIPLGYVLGFSAGYGVYGIWTALSISLILAAIFFGVRFKIKVSKL